MSPFKPDYLVVIDLESTCWENKEEQGDQESDIIEFGCVKLNPRSGEIFDKQSILAIPPRSSISKFCVKMTGHTNDEMMEKGLPFKDAFAKVVHDYDLTHRAWASYGEYDKNMIERCTKAFGIHNPLAVGNNLSYHINVKFLASLMMGKKPMGMDGALREIGFKLEGRHHNGADDAYNIAKILRWCLGISTSRP